MDWNEFLNCILDEKQIEVLKFALKIGARVHFYGSGLGKSTLVRLLQEYGFKATEPGTMAYGHCNYVPDGSNFVSFNVMKKYPKKLMPVYELLKDKKSQLLKLISQ